MFLKGTTCLAAASIRSYVNYLQTGAALAAEGTTHGPPGLPHPLRTTDRYPQTIYPAEDFREVVGAQYSVTGKLFA